MTARSLAGVRPSIGATTAFALPIGLSAFLLFTIEPLVGRLVLPAFGGTPAVWATTLFFFQAVLLIGYLYGHLSITRLGRLGPPLHLAIAGAGFVALVIAPAQVGALRIGTVSPVVDLVRILFVLVGVPAFVLTTTTPLVSGWFEAVRTDGRGDPYWLYALSNGGSLLALLAYPILIEPRLPLSEQRALWAVGYAALVVLLGIAAVRALPLLQPFSARAAARWSAVTPGPVEVPTLPASNDWPHRLRWLLLAAVPSGLLSAVTTFIATDLVSAPLVWVAPLAIYLASFVIAFSPRSTRIVRWAIVGAPAMVTLLWVPYGSPGGWPVLLTLPMTLLAFGVVSVAAHGRLAADRPRPARLTEFYLTMSTGGALASAFVGLLAPMVFPDVWEYPILLVAALVALAATGAAPRPVRRAGRGLHFRPLVAGARLRMAPYLALGLILAVVLVSTKALAAEAGIRWFLVGGLILLVGARPWFLALATGAILALAILVLQPPADFRARSFFGVTEVLDSPDGRLALLMNGTTVHGSQRLDAAGRDRPQSYYVDSGPVGDVFAVSPGSLVSPREVGVAGLGAGAIASHADASTEMTFFEIDPVVIGVASDPRFFSFVSDAQRRPAIIEGDARLSLASQPDGRFDLLILDAFSSDAVPVHLLTVEAIRDQVRTLQPDGLLVFHTSNRYYDLGPAIAAGVATGGLTVLEKSHTPGAIREPGETPSRWLAATRDASKIEQLRQMGWQDARQADHPFSDDYADLLRYLQLGS